MGDQGDLEVEKLLKKFSPKCPNLADKLTQLKSKVAGEELLKGKHLDDAFLLRFFNVRNFDVDATCELIKGYFTMRKEHPEFFQLPSQVFDVFKDQVFTLIPNGKCEGQSILIFQPGNWDPKKYPATLIAAGPVPFFEVLCATHGEIELIEILDFKDVVFRQFFAMPVSLHKLSADLSERAMPVKYSKIHIVNEGKLVDMLWTIMKPFVSEEMKNKLVFHGTDFKSLTESIDSSLVPVHLGGKLKLAPAKLEDVQEYEEKIKQYWQRYPAEWWLFN